MARPTTTTATRTALTATVLRMPVAFTTASTTTTPIATHFAAAGQR